MKAAVQAVNASVNANALFEQARQSTFLRMAAELAARFVCARSGFAMVASTGGAFQFATCGPDAPSAEEAEAFCRLVARQPHGLLAIERDEQLRGHAWAENCDVLVAAAFYAPASDCFGVVAAADAGRRERGAIDDLRALELVAALLREHYVQSERVQASAALRALEEREAAVQAIRHLTEARDRSLAIVSRELRRPLSSMARLIGQARREIRGGAGAAELEEALRTAVALREVIDDLIDMARLEASADAPRTTITDPQAVMESVALGYEVLARGRGLTLSVESTLSGRAFLLDSQRLRRALALIAVAAINNAAHGDVRLSANLEPAIGGRVALRFDVFAEMSDPMALAAWRRLQFAEVGPDEEGGLANAGLPAVQRLADLMRGEAGVKILPGLGASFWLRIDALESEVAAPTVEIIEFDDVVATDPLRVLFAAPDALTRFLFEETVRAFGWIAQAAPGPEAAISLGVVEGFDLVLVGTESLEPTWPDHVRALQEAARHAQSAPIVLLFGPETDDGADPSCVSSSDPHSLRAALLDGARAAAPRTKAASLD